MLAQAHCRVLERGDQGGTCAGNLRMWAVSLAVQQRLRRPEFLENVGEMGKQPGDGLHLHFAEHGLGEVRGTRLSLALDLETAAASATERSCRAGCLLVNAAPPMGTHRSRHGSALAESRDDQDFRASTKRVKVSAQSASAFTLRSASARVRPRLIAAIAKPRSAARAANR